MHQHQAADGSQQAHQAQALALAGGLAHQQRDGAQHGPAREFAQRLGAVHDGAEPALDQCRTDARDDGPQGGQQGQHEPVGEHRVLGGAGWLDDAELGQRGGLVDLDAQRGRFAPRHELFVVLADDVVVAVELGQLGFGLRGAAGQGAGFVEPGLLGAQAHAQRGDVGFGLGQGEADFLEHGVGGGSRRAGAAAALAECGQGGAPGVQIGALEGFDLGDGAPGADDVRVFFGVAAQQLVELLLEGVQAGFVLGDDGRHRGLRAQGLQRQLRGFGGEFALQGVARLLGRAGLQAQLVDFVGQGRHAGEVVLRGHAADAEVLQLVVFELVLGLHQLGFVAADLFFDEVAGVFGILLLAIATGVDEHLDQPLDQALGALGVGVAVADGVDVVAAAAGAHLDGLGQILDFLLLLLGVDGVPAYVFGGAQQLDVGPADEGAGEHADLLVDVGLEGQADHQGLEHALGVDVQARAGFVAVFHHEDPRPQNQ